MKKQTSRYIILFQNRISLFKFCVAWLLLGLFIIAGTPAEYESSLFIVPESIRMGGNALSIFPEDDIVGNELQGTRDAITPSQYANIVTSTLFVTSLSHISVTPANQAGTTTLYEYMNKHRRSPWWKTIIGLPCKAMEDITILFEKQNMEAFRLARQQAEVIRAIQKAFAVDVDIKRRTITLRVRMQDPLVAAIVADSVSARLQAYVTDYRQKKEFNTVEYIEKVHEEVRQRYHSSQETYAHFADRNRDLASKVAQSDLQRLRVEMNLAYGDYMRLSTQLQAAKGRAAKVRPVYTIIEPAKVPLKPVAPSPVKIVCVCVVFALLIGSGWIWVRRFYPKHSKRRQ